MVILGVDPGSLRTGYGAIDTDGRRHRLIEKGFIAPPPRGSLPERLRLIPASVEQQMTGFGRDEKGQVAFMLAQMLGLLGKGEAGDASDALSVALCHAH